jgi:outer membrane protein assembly factor BamA
MFLKMYLMLISCFLLMSLQLFAVNKKSVISDSLNPSEVEPNLFEINDIRFEGNVSFSRLLLLDAISSKYTSRSFQFYIFNYYYKNISKINITPKLVDTSLAMVIQASANEIKYFNQSNAELDVQALWQYYNLNGFHKAEINFSFLPDKKSLDNYLTFYIIENERFKIDTIVYLGLESIEDELKSQIKSFKKLGRDSLFSEISIKSEINSIMAALLANGYFYAGLELSPVVVNEKTLHDSVTVIFKPGKRQKIAYISFVDSLRGQNIVINKLKIQQMDFREGDWYNNKKIQSSLNNLNILGTFESVSIDTSSNYFPITDTTLSFVVTCKYRKQKEWSVGLFLNNTQFDNYLNVGVEGSIFHRNWGGAAQNGNLFTNLQMKNISRILSGEKGEWEGQIGFKVAQPIVWALENMKIGTSGSFYYSYSTVNQLFNISAWYFPIRFPIRLTNDTYLNQIIIDFNFEFQNPVNYLDVINGTTGRGLDTNDKDYAIKLIQSLNLYKTLYLYLIDPGIRLLTSNLFGLTLIGDSRNHPFSPTAGDYFYTSIDGWNVFLAHPWISGIAKFLRVQVAYSLFKQLSDNFVGAFKVKGGVIKLFDEEKAYVPFERQFFSGGSNSVRGWSSRELHYSVIESNSDTTNKNGYFLKPVDYIQVSNVLGSGVILEGSYELRYTFARPKGIDETLADQISKIGFVGFVDFGNTYHWFAETDKIKTNIKWYEYFTKVAWAIGFGIRYNTPIGPIRADFGFPFYRPNYNLPDYKMWDEFDALKDIRLQVGIGHAF